MAQESEVYGEISLFAAALLHRAGVRENIRPFAKLKVNGLYGLRSAATQAGDSQKALLVSSEILRRELSAARELGTAKAHAKAVHALISLLRGTASLERGTGGSAKAMSKALAEGLVSKPAWLQRYLSHAPTSPKPQHITRITGLSQSEWEEFRARIADSTSERNTSGVARVVTGADQFLSLNAAEHLSRSASRQGSDQPIKLEYDVADQEVKLARVSVAGFRGSPEHISLDLARNGKPSDVLLWGDNGTGKSTLVDGIEFALQRRVDRSADFNSTLRPAVRNLSTPDATASVDLSDGTVVVRSLRTNKAGRDEPSHQDVRPGFRLAPLVIRRADILRFLATDSLSRGTVFFDYFPDPAEALGVRPDEELLALEEENYVLRVARSDLASRLAEIYPGTGHDFKDAQDLDRFVDELVGDGSVHESANFTSIPQEARDLIQGLSTAQKRSRAIRKKIDKGVETLNPRAYQDQLERIRPILHSVTADLTSSFKQITRAQHVASIQVLVAESGPASLDVVVHFDNDSVSLPQQVFSEGYQDLIALLFFLAVTKRASEFGQAKVLILDDALQSVDSSIRLGLMNHVLQEFKSWQLIVTGHDRAWLTQLRGLFNRRGRAVVEREVSTWTFDGGIKMSGQHNTRVESLREALDRGESYATASAIGLLLEEISEELSWRFGTRVVRRQGDKYTLGDLWPGLAKELRSTSLRQYAEDIDTRIDIRNLVGAHYNIWADSIPWSDVEKLADDVLALYDATYCSLCSHWVMKQAGEAKCRCGSINFS